MATRDDGIPAKSRICVAFRSVPDSSAPMLTVCPDTVSYTHLDVYKRQAVIRAAINVKKAHPDWDIEPEIMIPLVCEIKELKFVKKIVVEKMCIRDSHRAA